MSSSSQTGESLPFDLPARDYQPYAAGAFRWRLGLRPLDRSDWIEVDADYDRDVERKANLMARHPATVNAAMPDTEAEGSEVLEALSVHLAEQWPSRFAFDGSTLVDSMRNSSHAVGRTREHPLFAAGRLVQEDLALLVERDGGAGSVCFPNRWDLSSKIGLALADVHAPVARLNEQLQEPIDSFLGRLTPEKPFWRLGWGVLDTGDPYTPLDGTASATEEVPPPGDPRVPDRLFLRVERETLRRFPRTSCVLFTIRTYIRPLRHLANRPEDARRLAEALENLPEDVREYKRTSELTDAAVQWLASVADVRTSESASTDREREGR
jgi:hypothetical protein